MAEQQEIITTFTEMAPRYESLMNNELTRFWGINYPDFVSQLLSGIYIQPTDQVLDIATGTGFIPAWLREAYGPVGKIFGLDITFGMLSQAQQRFSSKPLPQVSGLVCASAMQMPLKKHAFDQVICCLATHHMDATILLENAFHVMKPGAILHFADAGGSSRWKNAFVRALIKTVAFLYFLITENFTRALAESHAIGNVHTPEVWESFLQQTGFCEIQVKKLDSKKFWAPNPLIIKAKKS